MAKLKDKLYNRVIEGELSGLTEEDGKEISKVLVNKANRYISPFGVENISQDILSKIKGGDIVVTPEETYICLYYLAEDSIILTTCDATWIDSANYNYYETEPHWRLSDHISLAFDDLPLSFTKNTHSFAELDATLRGIINDAITDAWGSGVDCSQAQWNAIKALLDQSLYLNINGYSLIKNVTNGIGIYKFGSYSSEDNVGSKLDVFYDSTNHLLFVDFVEL